jgi:hypothetical protein
MLSASMATIASAYLDGDEHHLVSLRRIDLIRTP